MVSSFTHFTCYFLEMKKNTRGKIVTLLFTNMVIESARSVILENPIHCIYYTCNYTTGYEKFKQSSIPPISAKQTINTNLNSLNAIWHWKQHVGLEQTGPHLSSHWKLTCSRHDIAEKFLNWHWTTTTHSRWKSWSWLETGKNMWQG